MTPITTAGQDTRPRTPHDPHRAELIGALRDDARWLEDNPDVPITRYIAAIRMIQAQAAADRGQTGDTA